ncbi:hypothetical protein SAMN05880570_4172 [Paenibacillus sp. RU4T]|nr:MULTISPECIES: hypothetical protein [unclassified Paenibacillus]SIR55121.1 hypothetical protein SAMN05880555_4170 [Paenibacillus sp. RU4X]SIR63626.1 hypothetical protein SAMN05880570_4172 [Paenibacillus sp. RU4T]
MAKTARNSDRLTLILQKGNRRIVAKAPLAGIGRLVFVFNRQFTNAPNTTQIASGAGRSSAAGSNAAINSPYTRQQQSVGAGGKAINKGAAGRSSRVYSPPFMQQARSIGGKEVVIIVNDQVVRLPKGSPSSSATQIASGAGRFSTGGTNSTIESPGSFQQDAVGGGGTAVNKGGGKRKRSRSRKS